MQYNQQNWQFEADTHASLSDVLNDRHMVAQLIRDGLALDHLEALKRIAANTNPNSDGPSYR